MGVEVVVDEGFAGVVVCGWNPFGAAFVAGEQGEALGGGGAAFGAAEVEDFFGVVVEHR